jgi:hypothetical protein
MLKATQETKLDPIFAAIEAHRQATAARYPILETLGSTRDGAPERGAIEDAHGKAADIEVKATVKLLKTLPTTIAGVMAVTTYFVEPGTAILVGSVARSSPGPAVLTILSRKLSRIA